MTYTSHKLKNGLNVVLAPLKNTETVTVLFLVRAGSKYETKLENGISHFLEHMFFKGTKKRPNTFAICEVLDQVGGIYNAFTGKEYTGFYIKLAHTHLPLALDVLSDILFNSIFSQKEVDREKGVILEELKLYQDTPTVYVEEVFEKLLYGNAPAGREIIGTKENILSFSSSKLKEHLKTHYSADNSLVVVAGKIKPDTLKLVKKFFLSFPQRKTKQKKAVKEKQKNPQLLTFPKKTDQTHLCLGTRAFDLFDEKKYPLALLNAILGGGMSSRLFIKIRERQGLAYYIKSHQENYSDSGYFVIQAGINHQNIKKVVKLIIEELNLLKKITVKKKELRKAKEYLKGKTLLSLETSDSIASFLGKQKLLKDSILSPKDLFKKLDQVDNQTVRKIAQEIFSPEKLNLALITPAKNKGLKNFLTFK